LRSLTRTRQACIGLGKPTGTTGGFVIAILVDDEGAVQVLPLDRRGAERGDAVLLQQGERFLEVPYSTWHEFLGKTARLAEVQARAAAQWPLADPSAPAGTGRCPTCDVEFEPVVVSVRTPAPLTGLFSITARLQWRSEREGRWQDVVWAFVERPALRCPECGGLWLS
jgi:hypothetical protein